MSSTAALQPDPSPIVACTISRDVQNFDLLIEDMETELGENWGDLSFEDAQLFLGQNDSNSLEFIAIAIDEEDEDDIGQVAEILKLAKSKGVKALVIAEDVSPIALHQLLKLGAEEFVPYPLPDGALHDAIERLRNPKEPDVPADMRTTMKATGDRDGVVLPIQGIAGGVGSTTFAVNLAWELCNLDGGEQPRVCLIDFDMQFGSVSTFLDLPRREAVFEMISDTASMDNDVFMQALLTFNDKLHVLTAPAEMLPLDFVAQEDIDKILEAARTNFDYVIIDMPTSVVQWTETVLHASHIYFALMELDMRSAQNTLRMIRALKGEELPVEKLRFALNRAPKFTDLTGKSRVKRMADSLDIKIELQIPEGGKPVVQAGDHGLPLSEVAAKNPVRKEFQKLAQSVHELNVSEAAGG
ncbi:MAG: AAA family ATPase [Pseudomonadota bacterium]